MRFDEATRRQKEEKFQIEYLVDNKELQALDIVLAALFAFLSIERMFFKYGKKMEKTRKIEIK